MGVFAKAIWFPIPTSPLGATASGPVQSNDNRWLWWWTDDLIAAFDCLAYEWVGPFPWDGQEIACASQVSNSRCIFSYETSGVIYFRSFNVLTGAYGNFDWLGSSNYYNSQYHGYEGPFGSPLKYFGYDPGIPDKIVGFINDGLGPGVTAFVTAKIMDGRLSQGIYLDNQFGGGSLTFLRQGGVNGYFYPGRILAGDEYITIPNLPKVPAGAIASQVLQNPLPDEYNIMTVENTPDGRTYSFLNATLFYPDPFVFDGPTDFENSVYGLAAEGYGGFLGPNSLLLTSTVTGLGNPSSFIYTDVTYTQTGGTFGTAFPVSYSPVGDNPLSMCGYAQNVFVGLTGLTEWYVLAISQTSIQISSVVNYRWLGGPKQS